MGYSAFLRYTTVNATMNIPNRCTLGMTSIIILDAYIKAPSMANTAVSRTVSFTYFSTLKL